ncbi:hypothetical protein [Streptomyces sp. NPDC059742]|uniref:hypothetical protein n=2 Tax=unclassified Streptomyces TaxID=2593676 RepID=UPI00365B8B0E
MIDRDEAVRMVEEELERARIRGEAARTAADDLRDEVRAAANRRGTVHAMLTLRRRVPVLAHDQIVEYVLALQEGDAPAHLVDIVTRELVPPTDPVSSVVTLRGAEHRRAP